MDWLTKTESLDTDLEVLANYAQINYSKKSRQRIGGHKEYRTYYDENLIDLIYKTWWKELYLFGYSFDDIRNEGDVLLKNNVNLYDLKNKVKYNYNEDNLYINDRIIHNVNELNEVISCLKIM